MKRAAVTTAEFSDDSLVMEVPTSQGALRVNILGEMSWGLADDTATLEEHASKEVWWTAMHSDAMSMEARWKETVYEPFMAHLRRFAIYFLSGQGVKREKMTQRDIDDARLRLFTRTATEEQRANLTATAFYGYMLEKHDGAATVKSLWEKDKAKYAKEFEAFKADMFAYQSGDEPVWVEDAIDWRIDMEKSTLLLAAVSKAFVGRGYLLRQAAENEKARKLNMGGVTYEDLVKKIMPLIEAKMGNKFDTLMRGENT